MLARLLGFALVADEELLLLEVVDVFSGGTFCCDGVVVLAAGLGAVVVDFVLAGLVLPLSGVTCALAAGFASVDCVLLPVLRLAGACAFAEGLTVSVFVLVAIDLAALLFAAVVDCVVLAAGFVVAFFFVAAGAGDLILAVAAIVVVAVAAFVRRLRVAGVRLGGAGGGGGGGGSSTPLSPFTFGITNASNRSTSPPVKLDICRPRPARLVDGASSRRNTRIAPLLIITNISDVSFTSAKASTAP